MKLKTWVVSITPGMGERERAMIEWVAVEQCGHCANGDGLYEDDEHRIGVWHRGHRDKDLGSNCGVEWLWLAIFDSRYPR